MNERPNKFQDKFGKRCLIENLHYKRGAYCAKELQSHFAPAAQCDRHKKQKNGTRWLRFICFTRVIASLIKLFIFFFFCTLQVEYRPIFKPIAKRTHISLYNFYVTQPLKIKGTELWNTIWLVTYEQPRIEWLMRFRPTFGEAEHTRVRQRQRKNVKSVFLGNAFTKWKTNSGGALRICLTLCAPLLIRYVIYKAVSGKMFRNVFRNVLRLCWSPASP